MRNMSNLVIANVWTVGGWISGYVSESFIETGLMFLFAIIWLIVYIMDK